MSESGRVEDHYATPDIVARLLTALRQVQGEDVPVTPHTLAPLDHFHRGGLAATRKLAALLDPRPGEPPCCMGRRCGRTEPDPCSGLCDADILRASQLQHSVQHVGRDGHLARLSPVRLRTEPIPNDALPARDIGLHKSAPAVSRRPLPAYATALGNAS